MLADRLLAELAASPGLTIVQLSKLTGYSGAKIAMTLRGLHHLNRVMRRTAFEHESPGLRWFVYARTPSPGPTRKEIHP